MIEMSERPGIRHVSVPIATGLLRPERELTRVRLDILIYPEEVIRIIFRFDPGQPLVVIAVGRATTVVAVSFHHEVHVRSSRSIGMQRLPVVSSPGGNMIRIGRIR